MADDPLDLRHDRAQIFCAVRHGDIHEFFDRAAVRKIVVHRTDIVEPVGMGNKLVIGAVFRELLHTAVQISQHGGRLDEAFTFQFEDHFQHPMGGGVLGTHVEQEFLRAQRREGLAFRMGRIDLVDGCSLIFKGHRLSYRAVSSRNSNVSRQPLPRSGKSFRNG